MKWLKLGDDQVVIRFAWLSFFMLKDSKQCYYLFLNGIYDTIQEGYLLIDSLKKLNIVNISKKAKIGIDTKCDTIYNVRKRYLKCHNWKSY